MKDRASLFLAVALALPLIGLVASWATTHSAAQQGTDWEVPIQGYDPRDLLRGHYITYQYDWPGLARSDPFAYIASLCIRGKAPKIERVTQMETIPELPVPGCDSVAITSLNDETGNGLANGRFFVPQTKAKAYEDKLRDPRIETFVTLRIRKDGQIRPTGLTFRPRAAQ